MGFRELQEIFTIYNYPDVAAYDLYADLFHLGQHYIQSAGEKREPGEVDFRGNPICYVNDKEKFQGKMKHYIMLEDTFADQLREYQAYPSNLMNGVTYFGKKKDQNHADCLYALIFDIDEVYGDQLGNFFSGCLVNAYPEPNYVAVSKSGHGIHLYYLLEQPIHLMPGIKVQLKDLKYHLTRRMWNQYTSKEEKLQYQSYDQSFMVVGTKVSDDPDYPETKAFRVRREKWTLEELLAYIPEEERKKIDFSQVWIKPKYTLSQCKKMFPEWYHQVIECQEPATGTFTVKRDLYDWWKRKIVEGATYGHRFWCIMMLAIYGIKCDVPFEEVRQDAYGLQDYLNSLNRKEPFTKSDIDSALECYELRFKRFPRKDIARLSNIDIPKNKRNGRTQKKHLQGARAIRDINNDNWREGNGRPTAQQRVKEWRVENPDGRKIDCERETGLSRHTVLKWWDSDQEGE